MCFTTYILTPIIEKWMMERTRDEAENILNKNDIPVVPVYSAKDVFESKHVQARKDLVDINDPLVGHHQFLPGHLSIYQQPRRFLPSLQRNWTKTQKKYYQHYKATMMNRLTN